MPTPVTDGKHIWVKYSFGVVACYDLDGNRKWLVDARSPATFLVRLHRSWSTA